MEKNTVLGLSCMGRNNTLFLALSITTVERVTYILASIRNVAALVLFSTMNFIIREAGIEAGIRN